MIFEVDWSREIWRLEVGSLSVMNVSWRSLDFAEKCIKYYKDKFLGLIYFVELEALEDEENQLAEDYIIIIFN